MERDRKEHKGPVLRNQVGGNIFQEPSTGQASAVTNAERGYISKTSIGRWIEDYVASKGIRLRDFEQQLSMSNAGMRDQFGLLELSRVLQEAPTKLKLTSDETDGLAEAVAQTIEQRIKEGRRFQDTSLRGRHIRKLQSELHFKTYNGQQAADILGITRSWVSELRRELGLPIIMNEADFAALRQRFNSRHRIKTS